MKRFKKTIAAVSAGMAIGWTQPVHISGVVRTGAGAGIPGVAVRLGKAGLSATTDSGGEFVIYGSPSGIRRPSNPRLSEGFVPFRMPGSRFLFGVTEPTVVEIQAYDCGGRLLASRVKTVSRDDRVIAFPALSDGLQFFRVSAEKRNYTFRVVTGITADFGPIRVRTGRVLAKEAEDPTAFEDALLLAKEGFQLGRIPISNPDTSGLHAILVPLATGTMTDPDGNSYRTVRYGTQEWTVENLRTSRYKDGARIPWVSDSAAWGALETPGYSFFGYTTDTSEQRKWGAFYNGYAVATGKLAPAGWHVPTEAEWDTLENYLASAGHDYYGSPGGNKVAKSMASKAGWLPSADSAAVGNDTLANDASGFSGLANGYCDYAGETYYRNWYAFWWTATDQDSNFMKLRGLYYHTSGLESNAFTKVYGLSVRLVRDE